MFSIFYNINLKFENKLYYFTWTKLKFTLKFYFQNISFSKLRLFEYQVILMIINKTIFHITPLIILFFVDSKDQKTFNNVGCAGVLFLLS